MLIEPLERIFSLGELNPDRAFSTNFNKYNEKLLYECILNFSFKVEQNMVSFVSLLFDCQYLYGYQVVSWPILL
jgi:hypothetical protein